MSKIDEVRSAMVAAMKAGDKERKAVICEVLSGLGIEKPLPKDKGRIMKELMPKVKGKADGKVVNGLVASFME